MFIYFAMYFSMSSTDLIISADKLIHPSSVTKTSSSIRTPIPSSSKYKPGSTVNTFPGTNLYPES